MPPPRPQMTALFQRNAPAGCLARLAPAFQKTRTVAVSFQAMGFSISGRLDVQPDQVSIEMNLPRAAYPFKARIENEILAHARQLLG